MLPGPVFFAELRTTAHRGRYYAARALVATGLLAVLWSGYRALVGPEATASGGVSGARMIVFARSVFLWICTAQGVAVVVLTPALVAGAVAGEKSRRTLVYLLASDLTSAEIVLGKLGARLLHLMAFLAVGLPITSLLTLIGGTDPAEVLPIFAATAAIGIFLGGVSILASTSAREPREAVFAAYGLTSFWLAFPPLLEGPIRRDWGHLYGKIEPIARLLAMTNPLTLGPGPLGPAQLLRMAAILTLAGAVFSGLAVVLLRPICRSQSGEARRRRRWRFRLLPRPPIGDDPMGWKERRVARPPGLVGGAVRWLLALIVLGFAIETAVLSGPAFVETARLGYGAWRYGAARDFGEYLRPVGTLLYLLTTLVIATMAAGSITSEREADTWDSLLASPLEGEEILRAKRAGVYRRAGPFAVALLGLWVTGLTCGAVHPLGFVFAVAALPVYLAFAAALGTFVSLQARSTARSLAITVGVLMFLNGGYLFCCLPFSPESPVVALGCTPYLMASAPVSYEDVHVFFDATMISSRSFYHRGGDYFLAWLLSLLGYGFGAVVLNILAAIGFDSAVDRPARPGTVPSHRVAGDDS